MGKTASKKGRKIPYTKEQKRAKGKLAICVIALIVLCFAFVFLVASIVNAESAESMLDLARKFSKVEYAENERVIPVKDSDGYYTFTTDRDLKVLQITDVHIGGGVLSLKSDAWAMNAVAAMITAEKPDLVVVTGDIAYPVPFSAGTFNNLNATEIFAELMDSLGVYWTFAYGNHDTEIYSYYSREDLNNFYESKNYEYCLYQRGPSDLSGYGNSIIKVKNTQGIVTLAIVTLDSHSYTDGDVFGMLWKYDNLHQDQVDWYASEIDKINASNLAIDTNATAVKSLAFFHIALPEYRDAWKEYVDNGNKDTTNTTYLYGVMGESNAVNSVGEQTYGVYCGVRDDNFFETGLKKGLQGVFCGHDHYNNFSVLYQGVRLTYSPSIDYLAYPGIWNEKSQRGCTVITVKPDGSFDCVAQNYYNNDAYKAQFEKQ